MKSMILTSCSLCCRKLICHSRNKIFNNTASTNVSMIKLLSTSSSHKISTPNYDSGINIQSLSTGKLVAKPSTGRHISTSSLDSGVNVRPQMITSRLVADQLIRDLNDIELERLTQALNHFHEEINLEKVVQDKVPSFKILALMAFTNSLPFIGFGFLDNAIMIAAGEYIDIRIGAALGITTMAAAAIGNLISDVAGIGLAGYVEALAHRLGFEEPHLTPRQQVMKQTRIACHAGRAIGIVIGCLLGMFPLLLVPKDRSKHDEAGKENNVVK